MRRQYSESDVIRTRRTAGFGLRRVTGEVGWQSA